MRRNAPIGFALLALAPLAGPAAGQEAEHHVVSGDDVSGTATFEDDSIDMTLRVFDDDHPQGIEREIAGTITGRSSDAVRVSLSETFVESRGLAERVFRPWGEPGTRQVHQQVTLEREGDGALSGRIYRLNEDREIRTDDGQPVYLDISLSPRKVDATAEDLVVLVVPGLSTNLWNQYGVPYLDENLAALKARGLPARRLAVNTEDSVTANADYVAGQVRREVERGRRVVLIAHSKGGADTITALADPANRDLLPHVAGLVAIQPVYGGSPIADFVAAGAPVDDVADAAFLPVPESFRGLARATVRGIADFAFEHLLPAINCVTDSGSGGAWRELRTAARRASLAENPYPAERVPTVVVRGYTEGRRFLRIVSHPVLPTPTVVPVSRHVLRQPLVLFQRYTEQERDVRSDGMVSLPKQKIPGAVATTTLSDIDHFEPGFRGESPHTPCAITHRGVDLLLGEIAGGDAAAADEAPTDEAPTDETAGEAPTVDLPLGE